MVMGSRGNTTAELENIVENLHKSDNRSAYEIKRNVANQNQAEEDTDVTQDDDSREYGESKGDKKQHRANKVQRTEKSNTSICSSNVGESSESSCADSSDHNYDQTCSADDGNHKPTEIENIEGFMNIQKHSSWEVVSDKSTRVEAQGLKKARSQKGNIMSKKHKSQGRGVQNPKNAQNGHQLEQRQADDEKKHRIGDADDREESPSRRKRIRRVNEVEESHATDNIIQIMKFIRRMALLPDERLMQNLKHGFPLHAQNTILTGFRIIEWFQATESDMEEQ
ncbi:hypothetical protein RB213_010898 [Colletotrichum asianum]